MGTPEDDAAACFHGDERSVLGGSELHPRRLELHFLCCFEKH